MFGASFHINVVVSYETHQRLQKLAVRLKTPDRQLRGSTISDRPEKTLAVQKDHSSLRSLISKTETTHHSQIRTYMRNSTSMLERTAGLFAEMDCMLI